MMIHPDGYIKALEDAEYLNLIIERETLLKSIKEYEKVKLSGVEPNDKEWAMLPSPETRYQMNLKYLGKLCELMEKKYNRDYVLGNRDLNEDYEKL